MNFGGTVSLLKNVESVNGSFPVAEINFSLDDCYRIIRRKWLKTYGSPTRNSEIKTPLVVSFSVGVVFATSGVLLSGSFEHEHFYLF